MARVHSAKKNKAGKKIECGRLGCDHVIKPGETYYHWTPRYSGKHVRCSKHYPRASELTSSKLSGVYAAQEAVSDTAGLVREGGDLSDLIDELRSQAEEVNGVRDEYQESYDNMEQAFPSGCPTMEEIQEKIDGCETFAQNLEQAADEVEELVEEYKEAPDESADKDVNTKAMIRERAADIAENIECDL